MFRKYLLLFVNLFSLYSSTSANVLDVGKRFIPIQDIQIVVDGRYEKKSTCISFSNSATTLYFIAPEENFGIWIEDMSLNADQCNWLNVFSNHTDSKIYLTPGKHLYPLSGILKDEIISLVKATEANVGEVNIYGFQVHKIPENRMFDLVPQQRIQFIGNSITCGYGNVVANDAPPKGNPLTGFHAKNENASQSYAMLTANKIGAATTLVSFSGKGIYRNFDGDTSETMPKIYDRIHLQNPNSAIWDYRKDVFDLIVINLGTNDYFGESQNNPLNDSVFIKTYIHFVEKIIKYYPNAKIVCANGSMLNDGWPEGKKCWSRIQGNLKKVQEHFQAKGNTKIYTFFFTPQQGPYGEDYHPSLATHIKMAEELTTFIQTVVNK